MFRYLCLRETIKLYTLYYFMQGRKAVVIHWQDYMVSASLMLGVVLGAQKNSLRGKNPLAYGFWLLR